MRELLSQIDQWIEKKTPFAVATVIRTWGSSPRPVGSSMLITKAMDMAGSVSGGCVETAVVREAIPLIESGDGKRLAYGVADEDAWAVGLSCGGKIQVYLEPFVAFDKREASRAVWKALREGFDQDRGCVLVTALADGPTSHTVVFPDGKIVGDKLTLSLTDEALTAYRERRHIATADEDGREFFLQVFAPKPRLLIIGAAHITSDLVALATQFDFHVTVIDPRGAFADKTSFPVAPDELVVCYPSEVLPDIDLDPYTWAVVLSHDPKIDDDALRILLPSQVAYIGALGSKRTHAKRIKRLQDGGFDEEILNRIHAPIGLDINARTPREIALAILGEMIREKNRYVQRS
ncbi:MAG: XdhC family protein [Saprospiraceae bacterium]